MKLKHFFYALLALAFVGCSDDKYEGEEDTPVVTPTDEVKVTGYLGSYTRVNISQYGTSTQAFWSNGDQIALSTATQNNLKYQTSLSTATATKATFKATGDKLADTEGETVYEPAIIPPQIVKRLVRAKIFFMPSTSLNANSWVDKLI